MVTENSKWVGRIKWRDTLNSSREQEDEMGFLTAINKQWLGEYFSFFSFLPPAQGIGWVSITTSVGFLMCTKAPAAREWRAAFIYIVFTKLGSTYTCLAASFVGNWPTISQAFGRGLDRLAQQECTELISLGNQLKNNYQVLRRLKWSLQSNWRNWRAVWYLNSLCGINQVHKRQSLPTGWIHTGRFVCPGPVWSTEV